MALTDGPRLYLGSCTMIKAATLHCVTDGCNGSRRWYPSNAV